MHMVLRILIVHSICCILLSTIAQACLRMRPPVPPRKTTMGPTTRKTTVTTTRTTTTSAMTTTTTTTAAPTTTTTTTTMSMTTTTTTVGPETTTTTTTTGTTTTTSAGTTTTTMASTTTTTPASTTTTTTAASTTTTTTTATTTTTTAVSTTTTTTTAATTTTTAVSTTTTTTTASTTTTTTTNCTMCMDPPAASGCPPFAPNCAGGGSALYERVTDDVTGCLLLWCNYSQRMYDTYVELEEGTYMLVDNLLCNSDGTWTMRDVDAGGMDVVIGPLGKFKLDDYISMLSIVLLFLSVNGQTDVVDNFSRLRRQVPVQQQLTCPYFNEVSICFTNYMGLFGLHMREENLRSVLPRYSQYDRLIKATDLNTICQNFNILSTCLGPYREVCINPATFLQLAANPDAARDFLLDYAFFEHACGTGKGVFMADQVCLSDMFGQNSLSNRIVQCGGTSNEPDPTQICSRGISTVACIKDAFVQRCGVPSGKEVCHAAVNMARHLQEVDPTCIQQMDFTCSASITNIMVAFVTLLVISVY